MLDFRLNGKSQLEERIEKLQESALYIGLFGDSYGEIDGVSKKLFIELEYEEAKSHNIPCLIYFKKSQFSKKQEIQDSKNLQRFAINPATIKLKV